MRSINVAISIHLSQKPEISIWSNGAIQHAVFLYMLMKHLPYVNNVYLASDKSVDVEDKWLLDDFKADVVPLDEVVENVDLLIELSASVSAKHVASVRNRGGRFVAYRVGNDFVLTTESILFGAHNPSWCPNPDNLSADAIWINQQFERTCASFWRHLYFKCCCVAAFMVSHFLDKAIKNNSRSFLVGLQRKFRATKAKYI